MTTVNDMVHQRAMHSRKNRWAKLKLLCEYEAMTHEELCEQAVYDGIALGMCLQPGCDYYTEVESDNDAGWCEECGTPTVQSCLIMSGIC